MHSVKLRDYIVNVVLILLFSIILIPNLLINGKRLLLLVFTVVLAGFLYYYHIFLVYNEGALIVGAARAMIDFCMAIVGGYLYYILEKR